MPTRIHVLGFSGSLRKGSYNTMALLAAREMLPAGMILEIFDLAPLPMYNRDIDVQGGPEPVQKFKERIIAADALLIATPEYNYSIPGVLKNALDWASRPSHAMPVSGKPLAIMGAAGKFGSVRAQLHLRQIAVEMNMFALNKPEVHISRPWEKFDAHGHFVDEAIRQEIRALLEALADWMRRLRGE